MMDDRAYVGVLACRLAGRSDKRANSDLVGIIDVVGAGETYDLGVALGIAVAARRRVLGEAGSIRAARPEERGVCGGRTDG